MSQNRAAVQLLLVRVQTRSKIRGSFCRPSDWPTSAQASLLRSWHQARAASPNAAVQTRIVCGQNSAGSRESERSFKGIICDDVSKFESCMPSQAVRSLCAIVRAAGATSHQNAPVDFDGQGRQTKTPRTGARGSAACTLASSSLACSNMPFGRSACPWWHRPKFVEEVGREHRCR